MKRVFLPISFLILSSVSLFSNTSEKENYSINELEIFFVNDLVSGDTFYVQINDCSDDGSICIDIPLADIGNYDFTDNGANYSMGFTGCMDVFTSTYDYSQLFGAGNLGPYMLDSWTVDGNGFSGIFDSIPHLLDSMNLWDPMGNWVLDETSQIITGGNPSSSYDTMQVTVVSISAPTSIPLIQDGVPMGSVMLLAEGTHNIQIIDNGVGTCLDSFFVNVVCVQPSFESFTLEVDSVHNFCFDHSQLLGSPSSTEILCPSGNGTPANFDLISGNFCLDISAMSVGLDTACYVFCDAFGICDTTTFFVEVVPRTLTEMWYTGTLFVNQTDQVCINTAQMPGTPTDLINDCPDQSGEYAIFSINASTFCVDFIGVDVGKDTACVVMEDNLGNFDTTYVVICVINPTPDTIIQNIALGDSVSHCLDVSQFGGTVSTVDNICEGSSGNAAIYTLDNTSLCYNIVSNQIGVDTACIVYCDNWGVCDTTIFITDVSETGTGSLIARDDSGTTLYTDTLSFNVCDNDDIPDGILTNYYILTLGFGGVGPNYGTVDFDSECVITYTPNSVDCDVEDQFNYVICNSNACDTATMTVSVLCELPSSSPLEFSNGFSPNGDEVNQYFTIKGAETFPNNSLQIFNRWGNQIFKTENYQNDWDGSWNGETIQNGTYFYLFNDGTGNTYSGYVYIQK